MPAPPLVDLPYLTADVPAVPAAFKRRAEDFEVEELPLYEPSGEGEHVYVGVEKRGLGTFELIAALARELGVPRREIGCAGLKDAQGVARQTISISGIDPARLEALRVPGARVLWISRHQNKLKIGHLRGNRFRIALRDVPAGRGAQLRAVLDQLRARGVPNYFGEQRFGVRGDGWEVGRAVLRGDAAEALALMLGRPGPYDSGRVLRARELFEQGQHRWAAELWPRSLPDQSRLARALARHGDAARALRELDPKLADFYVSAWQSRIFNRALAERIGELDRVRAGDLAWKHDNGACFLVEDAAAETERAERFEISPSGPLFGRRMSAPGPEVAEIEARALAATGGTREEFDQKSRVQPPGGRRPLRFPLGAWSCEEGADDAGPFVELRFELPRGTYATAVLREIGKDRLTAG